MTAQRPCYRLAGFDPRSCIKSPLRLSSGPRRAFLGVDEIEPHKRSRRETAKIDNRVQVHGARRRCLSDRIVWPGVVQTLFREEAFVGHEGALMRAIGMTILLIGWLYVFGGRSGARQIVAASVIEPVAPELERIAALEDKKGFAEVVAYLRLLGTKPLFEADAVDECIRPPPFSCHRGHAPRL